MTLFLKRYDFGKNFNKRVKALLNNQESFIKNKGYTTKYLKLDKGTRQGDPIGDFFILVLEIVFNLIKQNKDIDGLTFFEHTFLNKTYADDTTLFLKDNNL